MLHKIKMKAVRKYFILVPLILFFVAAERYLLRQFWFDEALTFLNFALLPFEKIYFSYVIPNNHIGYTFLLRFWYLIAPQNVSLDVWCRLLSFVFAAAFIVFSWVKFKNFVFRTMLCCFAVSIPFVIYATSVRGYMAALFFSMPTVYCACNFARKGSLKNAVLFFISSLCCVSVLPTDLLILEAAVIYAIPIFGKKFYRKKGFYQLSFMAVSAFAIFWMPVFSQLIKAAQLGEGWHDRLSSLAAGGVSFSACLLVPLLFACGSLFLPYRSNSIRYLRLAVFCILLSLALGAKVAPFPRVYFPFFGIFMLIISTFASRVMAYIRLKKVCAIKAAKISFAILSLGAVLLLNYLPVSVNILSQLNGSAERDDFFAPWYCHVDHVPQETAKELAKENFSFCYLSFSADPWSVMFYSALNQIDMNKFYFDGPSGKVGSLPDGAIVVINKSEQILPLEKRFGGVFTVTGKTPMHTIYRYTL